MWLAGPAPRTSVFRAGGLKGGFSLARGLRVGLLGGSFNPAHAGHAHVARTAMLRLGLDRVIWLVSPQNPLKDARQSAPLAERMNSARRFARGPRMQVTDVETRLGVRYTIDTLRALKARWPGVDFVWIMGSDNLAGFHRWRGWTDIFRLVPVAVVARPGSLSRSRSAPAARRFAFARVHSREALTLPTRKAPAWTYLRAPLNPISSTTLRAGGRAERPKSARSSGAS